MTLPSLRILPLLASRLEILPALSGDDVMNEQMMRKHLDCLQDTGQISARPSAKEGFFRTEEYIKK